MVLRDGDGVREVGKAGSVPFDISPIQITTTGTADGTGFEVIGRVRWGWANGSWNEWLLLGVDGVHRWLGEAMGQFMLLTERPELVESFAPAQAMARGETPRIGTGLILDGTDFQVADIKTATCIGSEGELPFATPVGLEALSVDLRSPVGKCASIQREHDAVHLYVGRYVDLPELRPAYLRDLQGWPRPATLGGAR